MSSTFGQLSSVSVATSPVRCMDCGPQQQIAADLCTPAGARTTLESEAYPGELAQLREKVGRVAHIVDTLPAGVIILDGYGCVDEANQIAIEMLREPLKEQRWIDIIQRAFDPQSDDGHEVSLWDGRRIQLSISSLTPHAGQLILMTDLTETRLLQERLAHMKRLSALGKMVASLAHQVRTPLSAAILYAANLANQDLSAVAHAKFCHKLNTRLQDLEQQVSNMLLFAKTGEQQAVSCLSLQQLLTEVKDGAEAMVIQAKGEINIELPEPDIMIHGNQYALANAIQNLVHNSLEVIKTGAQITVSATRDSDDCRQVIISVKDNGPGIRAPLLDKIFEPFFTTKQAGTGLGLAVVKAVAHAHQGNLSLDANFIKGAKFDIRLPVLINNKTETPWVATQFQAQE